MEKQVKMGSEIIRLYDKQQGKFVSNINLIHDYFGNMWNHKGMWYFNGCSYETRTVGIIRSDDYNSWFISPVYQELRPVENSMFYNYGWMVAKQNGLYGLIDVPNRLILIDFKYTQISATGDLNSVACHSASSSQPRFFTVAELVKQSQQYVTRKQQEQLAEEQRKRDSVAYVEREAKLSSFTTYATAYVKPRMELWQQKGEFEKVADYTRRVSGENRQRKIDELMREAEALFIQENREHTNLQATLTLKTYDSEEEVFAIQSSKYGMLLVPVPISDGPAFKLGFPKATLSNEQYFIDNDHIALAKFDIAIGKKTYHYSNNNALNYSQYELNPDALNLQAFNIVTGSSTPTMRKPKVQILSPQSGSRYQDGTVEFRINIVPGDGQQPVLYVEINGADAVELMPVERSTKGARAAQGKLYELKLPTEPGKEVNLAFSARDEQNITSETQKVKLTYVGQVIKPKLILFAVGVGNYTSGDLRQLQYAAKDAQDFVQAIEQCNRVDYDTLLKHVYLDKQATRTNIYKGLREVLSEARQGDVVMFYFSGHGVKDGSENYFMTINASSEAPSDEGVSFAELKNSMQKLVDRKAKVLSFMDACHSGAMVGAKSAPTQLTKLEVQDVIEFYSCASGEESAELEPLKNGAFTAALISGLRGGAADKEGNITASRLWAHLSECLSRYSDEHKIKQTPQFSGITSDVTLFPKR